MRILAWLSTPPLTTWEAHLRLLYDWTQTYYPHGCFEVRCICTLKVDVPDRPTNASPVHLKGISEPFDTRFDTTTKATTFM